MAAVSRTIVTRLSPGKGDHERYAMQGLRGASRRRRVLRPVLGTAADQLTAPAKASVIVTLPLLPAMPRAAVRSRPGVSKPVAWGQCPQCASAARHALVRSGTHLVWRPHTYRTWSGAPLECSASGVALCALASRGVVTNVDKERSVRTRCVCLASPGSRA